MIRLRVKEILKEQNHSTKWLAEQIELPYETTLCIVENRIADVNLSCVEKIAKTLHVPMIDVFHPQDIIKSKENEEYTDNQRLPQNGSFIKRYEFLADLLQKPENQVEPLPDFDKAFQWAMTMVTKRQAQILTMYYAKGMTVAEIANKLGIKRVSVLTSKNISMPDLRKPYITDAFLKGIEQVEKETMLLDEIGKTNCITKTQKQEKKEYDKPKLETLGLSVYTYNKLKRANIKYLSELLLFRESDLKNITHFGPKCMEEINEKLQEHGLTLRKNDLERHPDILPQQWTGLMYMGEHDDKRDHEENRQQIYELPDETKDISVATIGLSARTRNCLIRGGIHNIGQLLQKDMYELEMMRNMGKETLKEIADKLEEHGIYLRDSRTPYD